MKKKPLIFASVLIVSVIACVTTAVAQGSSVSDIFSTFVESGAALTAGIIFIIAALAALLFGKKLKGKLDKASSSAMVTTFIVIFSVCGLGCLGLALATDGQSWLNMMYHTTTADMLTAHFSDYAMTARNAGAQFFYKSAERFSPMGLLIFFLLAQFMPTEYILNESFLKYSMMFKNQTIILLCLFLVLLAVVPIYRMNRAVLRKNELRIQDELVSFLLVVSFPGVYCIEMGNIAGFCLAAVMFFLLFKDAEKRVFRELSLFFLGLSAAVAPYTLLFALLLLDKKDKKRINDFVKTTVYFVVMFICPAFFTGFGNMLKYVKHFLSVSTVSYTPGNMSIANLLIFFGIKSVPVLYIVMLLTEIIAVVCLFRLPTVWQKCAAIAYITLNMFGISEVTLAIFAFIPFVFLLAEKKHKASDWLYFGALTLLITPIPAWYYFDELYFGDFLTCFGLPYIESANNLFSLAAVQILFIVMLCQTIKTFKKPNKTA